jgi:hypothetical protein
MQYYLQLHALIELAVSLQSEFKARIFLYVGPTSPIHSKTEVLH